jgi:hypothetical protein
MTHRELFFPAQLLLVLGIVHLDPTLDSLFDRHLPLALALAVFPLRSTDFGLSLFLLGPTQTFTFEPFLAQTIVWSQREVVQGDIRLGQFEPRDRSDSSKPTHCISTL